MCDEGRECVSMVAVGYRLKDMMEHMKMIRCFFLFYVLFTKYLTIGSICAFMSEKENTRISLVLLFISFFFIFSKSDRTHKNVKMSLSKSHKFV